MQHSLTYRRTVGIALLSLALLGSSCDNGGDSESIGAGGNQNPTTVIESTTTAAPATTTTTAAPTPEEQVLAAYHGYWAAVNEAFAPPEVEPESPALPQYATGEVLSGIVDSAEEAKAEGTVVHIPDGAQYSHRAEVVSFDGATATVRDCNINDAVLQRAGTGEILDDEVSTRLYIAMLVLEADQWKVATLDRANGWEGVAGCALE